MENAMHNILPRVTVSVIFSLFILLQTGCMTTPEEKIIKTFKPSKTFLYSPTVRINFEKHGSGPVNLILIHGFGSSIRTWDDVMRLLKQHKMLKHFTVYIPDMKGAGFSSKPDDKHYSIRDNAEILAAFIKKYKIEHPVLTGHSLGGGIALYATVSYLKGNYYPSHLILADCACYPTDFPFFVKFLRIPVMNEFILKVLPDRFRTNETMKRVIVNRKKITPELRARYIYMHKLPGYANALIETAKNIIPDDIDALTSGYTAIKCPVDIIWGSEDTILPLDLGVKLHKTAPDSSLTILPGIGHDVPEEDPAAITGMIEKTVK